MKKIIVLLLSVFILIAAFRDKDITITGNIKDENAHEVPFATIKAGSITAFADANGNYSITFGEKQEYLIFSAPGFITTKVKINNKNVINIILKARTAALEEVVVTTALGYNK